MVGSQSRSCLFVGIVLATACEPAAPLASGASGGTDAQTASQVSLAKYATVRLEPDLSGLSVDDRRVVGLLVEASEAMNEAFWAEAWGDRATAESLASGNAVILESLRVSFGPWDRFASNEPFVAGVTEKPAGANFYPADMTKAEFEAAATEDPGLRDPYTLVTRGNEGTLIATPYHQVFADEHARAAAKLREAATLSSDAPFANYLRLRASALETDDYRASDMAWMDLVDNPIDVIFGPVDTGEDRLFGYKTAHQAYVVIRDMEWSARLAHFADLLPSLQRGLPVHARYKSEVPGTDSDLAAYEVVFQAGFANTGAKHIALDLPNDEVVRRTRGSRRLQFENTTRAKFDEIMLPIADALISADQRGHVTFDAFFTNQMFHEVAHGLGVRDVVDGGGTVAEALGASGPPVEEGKADVLGLHVVRRLVESGELAGPTLDHQVTFLVGILRSVRFGAGSARARGGMILFNHLTTRGAILRDQATGTYRVDSTAMDSAVEELTSLILELQGNGAREAVDRFLLGRATVTAELQQDLSRLSALGIPHDIAFEQGLAVLEGR